jgi:hypothetical protein
VTVASVLSGLASSLCQWASQVRLVILPSRKSLLSQLTFSIITGKKAYVLYDDYRDVIYWEYVLVSKYLSVTRRRSPEKIWFFPWMDFVDSGEYSLLICYIMFSHYEVKFGKLSGTCVTKQ